MQSERFFADLSAAWQDELDERAELEGTLPDWLDEGPATPAG
jgi:hypothetical protein